MSIAATAVSIDFGSSRNYAEEHENLAVAQGIISQADAIIKNWEHSEFLVRRTILSINEHTRESMDYSSQVRLLKEEATKLTRLFDQIGEILLSEPTCCKIKQSTILGWGTSVVGFLSGGAGLGTVIQSYMANSVPSIAPIILTASGVAVVGFQILFWNKMKQNQEDRTKLLVLRARYDVIIEAREMAKLLQKVMRADSRVRLNTTSEPDRRKVDDLLSKIRLHKNRCAQPDDEEDPLGFRAASSRNEVSKKSANVNQPALKALRFAYSPRSREVTVADVEAGEVNSPSRKPEKEKSPYSAQAMIESMKIPAYEESYTNSIEASHVTFGLYPPHEDTTSVIESEPQRELSHSERSSNSGNGSDKSVDIFSTNAAGGTDA